MKFEHPLIEAVLIKRYKRFLADVTMSDGSEITVHCANPGSMAGLTDSGNRVWISDSKNPKRKLRYSWEMTQVGDTMVGVNTNLPNKLAVEAINKGLITPLNGFKTLKTEVKYGINSRIDILLEGGNHGRTYVEVKNVHFRRAPNLHEFPDSVTARGAKHLDEMANQVREGDRAAMVYVIQRDDGDRFALARDLDPNYATAFDRAISAGVEAYAIKCTVSSQEITATEVIPVLDVA